MGYYFVIAAASLLALCLVALLAVDLRFPPAVACSPAAGGCLPGASAAAAGAPPLPPRAGAGESVVVAWPSAQLDVQQQQKWQQPSSAAAAPAQ
jgi:hypothetical protein